MTYKWVRAKEGKSIAGVCAGIARGMEMDPVVLRLCWLIAVLLFGVGALAYLIFALCLPREDRVAESYKKKFLGVCVRLAERQGWEPGLLRALFVIVFLSSCGAALLLYLAFHFVLKTPPRE